MKKSKLLVEGFTLLELLVAILIFTFSMTLIYGAFQAGIKTGRFSRKNLELYQNARAALSWLTADIRCAFPYREEDKNFFNGGKSGLEFASYSSGSLKKIRYHYDEDSSSLRRVTWPRAEEEPPENNRGEALAEKINQCGFSYFDGEDWLDFWDEENAYPRGIAVVLRAKEGEEINLRTKISLPGL